MFSIAFSRLVTISSFSIIVAPLIFIGRCYAQDEPAGKFKEYHIVLKGERVRYLKRSAPTPAKAKEETQTIETSDDNTGATTKLTRKTTTRVAVDAKKVVEYVEDTPKISVTENLKMNIIQKGDTLYFKPWKWTIGNPTGADEISNETAEGGKFFRVIGDEVKSSASVADRNKATFVAQAFNPTIKFPRRSIDVGVIAIPVTVLLHQYSTASVTPNAGIYIGRNLGFTRYYMGGVSKAVSRTILLYGGGANLDLSKKNTPGLSDDDKGSNPFLTFGLGYLRGTTKLSGGAVVGWYVPLTGAGKESRYSEAPYIGLLLSLKISG